MKSIIIDTIIILFFLPKLSFLVLKFHILQDQNAFHFAILLLQNVQKNLPKLNDPEYVVFLLYYIEIYLEFQHVA